MAIPTKTKIISISISFILVKGKSRIHAHVLSLFLFMKCLQLYCSVIGVIGLGLLLLCILSNTPQALICVLPRSLGVTLSKRLDASDVKQITYFVQQLPGVQDTLVDFQASWRVFNFGNKKYRNIGISRLSNIEFIEYMI